MLFMLQTSCPPRPQSAPAPVTSSTSWDFGINLMFGTSPGSIINQAWQLSDQPSPASPLTTPLTTPLNTPLTTPGNRPGKRTLLETPPMTQASSTDKVSQSQVSNTLRDAQKTLDLDALDQSEIVADKSQIDLSQSQSSKNSDS